MAARAQSNQSPQMSREALELEGLGPSAETMELAALQASHRGRLFQVFEEGEGPCTRAAKAFVQTPVHYN